MLALIASIFDASYAMSTLQPSKDFKEYLKTTLLNLAARAGMPNSLTISDIEQVITQISTRLAQEKVRREKNRLKRNRLKKIRREKVRRAEQQRALEEQQRALEEQQRAAMRAFLSNRDSAEYQERRKQYQHFLHECSVDNERFNLVDDQAWPPLPSRRTVSSSSSLWPNK